MSLLSWREREGSLVLTFVSHQQELPCFLINPTMSSVMSTIDQLNAAAASITLALTFGSLIPGCIGLLLNIVVFSRPSLRRHSCSIYFLASTCVNLFVMFIIIPVRIASNSFNLSLSDKHEALCKVEYFLFYSVRSLSCWLILLVCIDRYIHSVGNHPWRRRLTLPCTALAAIIVMTTVIFLGYSHMPVYYNLVISVNQNGAVSSFCASQRGTYRTFVTLWHIAIYSLCPSVCMLIVGLFTVINIRQHRNRVAPHPGPIVNQVSTRRTDGQLLRMLAVQVFIIIVTTAPGQLFILYQALSSGESKSALRQAQERVMAQSFGGISYISHASGFYLYTLTGSVFRKELIRILSKAMRFCRSAYMEVVSVGTLQASVKSRRADQPAALIPGIPAQ